MCLTWEQGLWDKLGLNQTRLFFVLVIVVQGNPTFQRQVAKYEGTVVIALSILKC
jgi:hypothetical protein